MMAPLGASVLDRIIAGAIASPHTPRDIQSFAHQF
jgi:hypothetical protein